MQNRFIVRLFSLMLLTSLLAGIILTMGCGAKGTSDTFSDPNAVSPVTKIQDLGPIRARTSQTPQAVTFTQLTSGASVQAVSGAIFYDLQTKLQPPYNNDEKVVYPVDYQHINDGSKNDWNPFSSYTLDKLVNNNYYTYNVADSVSISPDGKKIVMNPVMITPQADTLKSYLYISNVDGTNLVKIGDGLPALPPNVSFFSSVYNTANSGKIARPKLDVAWSKNQVTIAFSDINGTYIIDTNTKRVNKVSADIGHPVWSPDGTKIAFASPKNIYIADINGTVLVKKTVAYTANSPVWSVDGQNLAFTAVLENMEVSGSNYRDAVEVYTMSVSGTNIKRLTTNKFPELGMQWSLDGTKIAYDLQIFTDYETYIINADGQNQIKLNRNCHYPSFSVWSPDGRQLAFTSELQPGSPSINLVNADGSNETVIPTGFQDNYSKPQPWYYTNFPFNFNFRYPDISQFDGKTQEIADIQSSKQSEYRKLEEIGDSWLPFTRYKNLVGNTLGSASGDFGYTAAGYLRGEKEGKSTSLVLFNTPTGSHESVTITPLASSITSTISMTNATLDELLFVVKGSDGVNAFQYMSFNAQERPVESRSLAMPSGTIGVVVGFSPAGTVSTTIPFQVNSPVSTAPSGDLVTISGKFPAVYNAKGENIAPIGARTITLNGKTGSIIKVE
jgi:Tol biopolymer transport system component